MVRGIARLGDTATRRYGKHSQLSLWLAFALRCEYMDKDQFEDLDHIYDNIIGRLVRMLSEPKQWSIR
jgi:hypothetical protein